jgi:DNA-binding FadR family transcriptional regulator
MTPVADRKADLVSRDLLARISTRKIAAGALLPNEAALATHYGVNRSVVREAVKTLEAHRLLEPVRRRGTRVLDPLASLAPEVLRAMLRPEGRAVDPRMLRHLLEIRALVDAQMSALAAERRSEEDLAGLDERLAALDAARHLPNAYGAAAEALALAIARATQNPLFEMLCHWHGQVYEELQDLLVIARPPSEPHFQGTRELVRAIRARDAALARALTEAYHEWATPVLLAAVGGLAEGGPE